MSDVSRDVILRVLQDIVNKNDVWIIHACESGSRAWGFASEDSDYDVRFIYVRKPEWYMSIDVERKRDVIELPPDKVLDVSGWDFRKALQLLRKSNPPLLEHLGSPVIYNEDEPVMREFRDLARQYYSPSACAYHYLHMARGNVREYLKGDEVWLKKYLYVIRPLLAVKWIEDGFEGPVPTMFFDLVDQVVTQVPLYNEINNLVCMKQEGHELGRGPAIPIIDEFIRVELARLEGPKWAKKPDDIGVEPLNEFFRKVAMPGRTRMPFTAARFGP